MHDVLSNRRLFLLLVPLLLGACGGGGQVSPLAQASSAVISSRIVSLAAGDRHACALDADGGVLCWGDNFSGQLGEPVGIDAFSPVPMSGWPRSVSALVAGTSFTCALIAGGAQCLGGNQHGQLGDGTNLDSSHLTTVAGLGSGVAALAAGKHFLCGLTGSGAVRCLGDNRNGQLGDRTTTDAYAAQDVAGLAGAAELAAGEDAACALSNDGTVRCWGSNAYGELGSGATAFRTSPGVVVTEYQSGIAAVSPGTDFTCVLTTGGGASCIGDNGFGQLGSGSPQQGTLPYGVKDLGSGVSAVASGDEFACALMIAGSVRCWGDNSYGQLGDGNTIATRAPVQVTGLDSGMTALAVGAGFACAADGGGAVHCWGDNTAGQLGSDIPGFADKPVTVNGVNDAVAVAAGADFACALTTAGSVLCWGDNGHGQLGDGSTLSINRAVDVKGLAGVTAISAGYGHACALDAGGRVWCWGRNARGELGDGSRQDATAPVAVTGLSGNIAAIAAGRLSTCAADAAGTVQCWGDGAFGELGNGTTSGSLQPATVAGLGGGATAIGASQGRNAFCAVVGGALRCWGDERIYRLYSTSPHLSTVPVLITGLDQGAVALALGAHHACIVNGGGGVQCWGNDGHGELGDGTVDGGAVGSAAPAYTLLAETVVGLRAVRSIAAGRDFTCALGADGTVSCWGRNDHGQLGNGTTTDSAAPVAVQGLRGATALVAGGDFACALTGDSRVLCWGNNDAGQLGSRTAASYPRATVPVPAL